MRRDTQCRALRVGLAAFDTVQDIASDCREEAGLTTSGLCAGIGVDRAEYRVKRGICAGRNGKFQSPSIKRSVVPAASASRIGS